MKPRPVRSIRASWWAVAMLAVLALVAAACEGQSSASGDEGEQVAGTQVEGGGDGGDGPSADDEPADDAASFGPPFRRFERAIVTDLSYGGASIGRWVEEVPGIADVRIPSTADDYQQPALWLAHQEEGSRPLLVVLHSWSVDYRQHLGIPYARWARDNGWAMIHPDFRGVSNSPDATGSDRTVQDILDAIEFAKAHAAIDEDLIFVTGFSGGGMMSLVMAGRHPEVIAGAVAWVPIYDLVEWYSVWPSAAYARQIRASCGGDPTTDEGAAAECAHRSPAAHLDAAADADVPVYIGHGLSDGIVSPVHAVWAFNHLAADEDRLDDDEADAIGQQRLPDHLRGEATGESFFREPDPATFFTRRSGPVTLTLFDGEHAAVYNPGLEWMVEQASRIVAERAEGG